MRLIRNFLGICIPHVWGPWRKYGPDNEVRQCCNCNEQQFKR